MKPTSNAPFDEVWTSYAKSYDRILPVLPFYQEVPARHIDAMCHGSIRKIIDIGTGTGNVAMPLAIKGLSVTAIDNNPEMLRYLLSKSQLSRVSSISIVNRDASDLSLWSENAFDGVTILLALFAMEHPREAIQEVIRVLRTGGRLVVTETKRDFQLEPLLEFVAQASHGI
jgi:ubiquinone/menaquinone biosynthesis C-methylase UbiE